MPEQLLMHANCDDTMLYRSGPWEMEDRVHQPCQLPGAPQPSRTPPAILAQ
jgi:hypothetical protein